MSVPSGKLLPSATRHSDERKQQLAKFKIESKGTVTWDVEAEGYKLESEFFHFYSDGAQVFAVRADNVRTIRADNK